MKPIRQNGLAPPGAQCFGNRPHADDQIEMGPLASSDVSTRAALVRVTPMSRALGHRLKLARRLLAQGSQGLEKRGGALERGVVHELELEVVEELTDRVDRVTP